MEKGRRERRMSMYERTAAEWEKNAAGTGKKNLKNLEDASATSVHPPHKVLIALGGEWRHG
jgi:hypothetical protein